MRLLSMVCALVLMFQVSVGVAEQPPGMTEIPLTEEEKALLFEMAKEFLLKDPNLQRKMKQAMVTEIAFTIGLLAYAMEEISKNLEAVELATDEQEETVQRLKKLTHWGEGKLTEGGLDVSSTDLSDSVFKVSLRRKEGKARYRVETSKSGGIMYFNDPEFYQGSLVATFQRMKDVLEPDAEMKEQGHLASFREFRALEVQADYVTLVLGDGANEMKKPAALFAALEKGRSSSEFRNYIRDYQGLVLGVDVKVADVFAQYVKEMPLAEREDVLGDVLRLANEEVLSCIQEASKASETPLTVVSRLAIDEDYAIGFGRRLATATTYCLASASIVEDLGSDEESTTASDFVKLLAIEELTGQVAKLADNESIRNILAAQRLKSHGIRLTEVGKENIDAFGEWVKEFFDKAELKIERLPNESPHAPKPKPPIRESKFDKTA